MPPAAQLGADEVVGARLVGLEPDECFMPGTASCLTRRFGRKKLCSTSWLLIFSRISSFDRHVQVVDDDACRRACRACRPSPGVTNPPFELPAGDFDHGG